MAKLITKPCEECEYGTIEIQDIRHLFPWFKEYKPVRVLRCSKSPCPFQIEDVEEEGDRAG